MKKSVLALSVILTSLLGTAYADDADILKQFDIRACQSEAKEQADAGQDEQPLNCQCKIDNTDYKSLAAAKKQGDLAKVQKIKQKARDACTENA
ncbi:hypothetical protein [Kangiella shandongensis]|uniref:hypothetical protein n=1 Tax=Kangiella shandongensis TaxID=2763258 RepID=UPI001CBEEB57|nr:hypothetical protein [Kangiella shandongensis]